MHARRSGLVGVLLVLLAPAEFRAARGDLVSFEKGGSAQLPAEIDGEVVRLIGPDGPVEFRLEDFRAIVPGHWPDREWPALRDRAEAGDAADRYQAAWWALEHGLTPEAVAVLRSAYQADPAPGPVARMVTLLDRLDRPAPAPDLAALRPALPGGEFTVAEGRQVVLLHQQAPEEAEARLDLLDRVLTTYYLTFAALGFDLRTPAEKLVAVWFAEEADYLAYIRKEAGESFLSTRGYYHPTRRAVFCYDGRSRAEHERAGREARARLDELDRAEQALSAVRPGARFRLAIAGEPARTLDRDGAASVIDRLRREAAREALLRELDRLRIDGGAAVHELIHQLVIESGLAPRYDRFPVWLHEGLAMQFEEFRGGRWAGLGPVSGHRLDQWRRLSPPPPLEPLLRDEGFGRGYAPERYAAAWALVDHLRRRQPGAFVALLDRLRNPVADPGTGQAERVVAAFRAAVDADLSAFRRAWIAEMAARRTAIESIERVPPAGPRRGR